jgi:hypothetical protein
LRLEAPHAQRARNQRARKKMKKKVKKKEERAL